MTILSDESLEFARDHIMRYYDSDFFPRQFEFWALWEYWDEVKKYLTGLNVHKIPSVPPTTLPWAKPRGGYRIVHQLDPVDAIVYTALAFQIANDVENARAPVDERIACAYRIDLDEGSFFSGGSGYEGYRDHSIELAEQYEYVLLADIADYYNQIYTHRLNNAIEHANGELKGIADDIETFISKLNFKTSQGIPVGPAASIIMAEAIMIDVDQNLASLGHPHVRYVDDIRVFANTEADLRIVLQELTQYLYQTHRLSLSSEKTRVIDTKSFLQDDLNNPYELEKIDVIERIAGTSHYGNPEGVDTEEKIDADDLEVAIASAKTTVNESLIHLVERQSLDLGFCRALIRQARAIKDVDAAKYFLDHVRFFEPVANNFIVYLHAVTDEHLANSILPKLESIIDSGVIDTVLLRFWFEWYFTERPIFLASEKIYSFLATSPNVLSQAKAAVLSSDISWVRKRKGTYFNFGPRERRAILYASQILPDDERSNWLKNVIDASALPLENWVARYFLAHFEDPF